jgi:hypothetical protein
MNFITIIPVTDKTYETRDNRLVIGDPFNSLRYNYSIRRKIRGVSK